MSKVRYIGDDYYPDLTNGKVYDVLNILTTKYPNSNLERVCIINDYNIKGIFFLVGFDNTPFFVDVTKEYRNKIIDGILE